MVKRGDVWLAALDPTIGREIKKTRPCLIISPSDIHDHLRTVIVAPTTSGSRQAGFRVQVGRFLALEYPPRFGRANRGDWLRSS
jgi:mRNA interferase MazF